MITSSADIEMVLAFAPEWEQLLRHWQAESHSTAVSEFLNRVGAQAIFRKASSLGTERDEFIDLLQAAYYQPMLQKMLSANQNLRRFLAQRHVSGDQHKGQVISLAADIALKMKGTLSKQVTAGEDDGFKVLLPAYVQRTVHNAVIDYIRSESTWERQTLQDVYLDPQGEDPRASVADDAAYTPEQKILSGEQVGQLNQLRAHLQAMLKEPELPREPLVVVDCMFGLGLTDQSTVGQELTMREVCDKLSIPGETQARRIARCQVHLDKGLELIRARIYKQLPGIAECWQRGLNVNTASRRELAQQLGMTEGEIERCIKGRQFDNINDLCDRSVVKSARLDELVQKGAVAAFVPVDLNNATARDITDIVGAPKELAQRLVSERPFKDLSELVSKKLVKEQALAEFIKRGAVVRARHSDNRRADLNRITQEDMIQIGLDSVTADIVCRTRPFGTWAEVEEFLGPDSPSWAILRQRFFLGLTSG